MRSDRGPIIIFLTEGIQCGQFYVNHISKVSNTTTTTALRQQKINGPSTNYQKGSHEVIKPSKTSLG